jgi:hydroxyacylglutathione hydrolase
MTMPDMYFKQLLHEECGCSSYVVGGRSTNEVAVIDPALDVGDVLELLRVRAFDVRYVIDTHVHADHVSGARRLAEHTGAQLCMGDGADVRFPFTPLRDGDELPLGNVRLRVLHTPGHRPESVTLLVVNSARTEQPSMAITGDTLLVGDVGRPDFGGEQGARELWASIQRLLALEDYVEVFPSHFEGACGKGMCGRPSSTIGFERRFNPALQVGGVEEFVRAISADLPARPLNMDAIVATNIGEKDAVWAMPQGRSTVPEIDPAAASAWVREHDAAVVDVREPSEYRDGHIPGAASIPQCQLADRLAEVPRDRDVLLVCRSGVRSLRCAWFLKQTGYERVTNLRGGTLSWIAAALPVETPPATSRP